MNTRRRLSSGRLRHVLVAVLAFPLSCVTVPVEREHVPIAHVSRAEIRRPIRTATPENLPVRLEAALDEGYAVRSRDRTSISVATPTEAISVHLEPESGVVLVVVERRGSRSDEPPVQEIAQRIAQRIEPTLAPRR